MKNLRHDEDVGALCCLDGAGASGGDEGEPAATFDDDGCFGVGGVTASVDETAVVDTRDAREADEATRTRDLGVLFDARASEEVRAADGDAVRLF